MIDTLLEIIHMNCRFCPHCRNRILSQGLDLKATVVKHDAEGGRVCTGGV